MPDVLSDYDRRLIADAVQAGRITRVPVGASGIPLPIWDGSKLISPDPKALKKAQDRLWKKMRQPDPKLMERRRNVGQLFREGLTTEQIAVKLETPLSTIKKDLQLAGLKREREKPVPPPKPEVRPSQARRDEAVRLYRSGMSSREIAAKLGVMSSRVRVYLRDALGPLQWDRKEAAKKAAATKRARRS